MTTPTLDELHGARVAAESALHAALRGAYGPMAYEASTWPDDAHEGNAEVTAALAAHRQALARWQELARLRSGWHGASEDGTGRGTPLVPIAFSAKDYGGDAMEDCSPTLRAGGHSGSHANAGVMPAVAIQERAVSENPDNGPQGAGYRQDGAAYTLEARNKVQAVAFDLNQITSKTNRSQPDPSVHHTLPATSCQPHLAMPLAVRRLTPRECERLQGFPDGWTDIPYRNKRAADGPRYKALGNSWAVNCGELIFDRLRMVEALS